MTSRESERSNRRSRPTLVFGVLAVSLMVLGAGCADDPSAARGKERPQGGAVVVDVAGGTVAGVRLGDSRAAVRRRLGPAKCSASQFAPLGEDSTDFSGPATLTFRTPNPSPARSCRLRYRGLVMRLEHRYGAHAILTTDPSARTTGGIGIGDDVEAVKREYPAARCYEEDDEDLPYCVVGRRRTSEADPGSPRELYFGLGWHDGTVASIMLNATSPRGLATRARRRAP